MILMHSSGPSASKPLHDNTAKREQNLHYGYYNGLTKRSGTRRGADWSAVWLAAESRASIPASVRRAARRQVVERLRALQAEARD